MTKFQVTFKPMIKLGYVLTMLCLMSCVSSKQCFKKDGAIDLTGTWQVSCEYCDPNEVSFYRDSTGIASRDGYFEAIVNDNSLPSFDWFQDSTGKLNITWSTIDNEQANHNLLIQNADCNQVRLWDQVSDTHIELHKKK